MRLHASRIYPQIFIVVLGLPLGAYNPFPTAPQSDTSNPNGVSKQ